MNLVFPQMRYYYEPLSGNWTVEQLLPSFLGVFAFNGELTQIRNKLIARFDELIADTSKPVVLKNPDYFVDVNDMKEIDSNGVASFKVQFDRVDLRPGSVEPGKEYVDFWGIRKPLPEEHSALKRERRRMVKTEYQKETETLDRIENKVSSYVSKIEPIYA